MTGRGSSNDYGQMQTLILMKSGSWQKKMKTGICLAGIWGVMSDFSHQYNPWEDNFSRGLYLAGIECNDDAEAPEGWMKWTIPGYEYIYAESDDENTFSEVLDYMKNNDIPLAGAVHDFTCPLTGKNYMFFPVRKIQHD